MLITGANKGIGYSMCREWLKKGNTAIVLDLSCVEIDKLKPLYDKRLLTFECDVTDDLKVNHCISKAVETFDTIDIAVHNACSCEIKSMIEHHPDDFRRIMDVNFQGAVYITRSVLPLMIRQKGGRICFTSSGVGVTGYINISGYAASKGAIESFARCLALEHKNTGVSFHLLHPPLTNTESASLLQVPSEFKADPDKVGKGLIKNIYSDRFIIVPDLQTRISIWMSYHFPKLMGLMLVRLTGRIKS